MKNAHLFAGLAIAVLSLPSFAITQAEIDKALASQKVPLMCSRLFEAMSVGMDLTEPQKAKLKNWEQQMFSQALDNARQQLGKLDDGALLGKIFMQAWQLKETEYRDVMDSVNGVQNAKARNKQLGDLVQGCTNAAERVLGK